MSFHLHSETPQLCSQIADGAENVIKIRWKALLFVFPPEYSRYMHSHLDIPVAEYNVDQDLPGNFKNHWAKNLPFLIEDYEEQPGLQPHIK